MNRILFYNTRGKLCYQEHGSLPIYVSFLYAFFYNSLGRHLENLENCDWCIRLSVEIPVEQNAKMPPC